MCTVMYAACAPLLMAQFLIVVQATIARRDTLLALFDLVADVQPDIAVKLLRCVKHLTRDPSMLLPLHVRTAPHCSAAIDLSGDTCRRRTCQLRLQDPTRA